MNASRGGTWSRTRACEHHVMLSEESELGCWICFSLFRTDEAPSLCNPPKNASVNTIHCGRKAM